MEGNVGYLHNLSVEENFLNHKGQNELRKDWYIALQLKIYVQYKYKTA